MKNLKRHYLAWAYSRTKIAHLLLLLAGAYLMYIGYSLVEKLPQVADHRGLAIGMLILLSIAGIAVIVMNGVALLKGYYKESA